MQGKPGRIRGGEADGVRGRSTRRSVWLVSLGRSRELTAKLCQKTSFSPNILVYDACRVSQSVKYKRASFLGRRFHYSERQAQVQRAKQLEDVGVKATDESSKFPGRTRPTGRNIYHSVCFLSMTGRAPVDDAEGTTFFWPTLAYPSPSSQGHVVERDCSKDAIASLF